MSTEVHAILGIFEDFGWRIPGGVLGVSDSAYGLKDNGRGKRAIFIWVSDGILRVRNRPLTDITVFVFEGHLCDPDCFERLRVLLESLG